MDYDKQKAREAVSELDRLRAVNAELVALAKHVDAMTDDAYFTGHPEWSEIASEAREALSKAGKEQ